MKTSAIHILGLLLLVLGVSGCKKDDEARPYLVTIAGLIQDEVSITGVDFNPVLAENRVFLNSAEAEVISVDPTLVKFIVPDLPWGNYEVTLFSGETIYTVGNFTVLFPVDPITLHVYYPLNGSAVDLGPLSNRGTESGDLTFGADRHGQEGLAAGFDGIDDVITTPSTPDFEFRTVSFWFYPTNVMSVDTQVILSVDDNNLLFGRIKAEINNGTLTLWAAGLGTSYSMPVQNNVWYHIVLARDPDLAAYFVDGSLAHYGDADGDGSTVNPNNNLVIGAGNSEDSEFFQGFVDEIIIFNRVLSEEEIVFLGEY